jgi:succinylglutamate desuccinylase
MKRFLSPEQPLLVFKSRPDCDGALRTCDDAEEEEEEHVLACQCAVDACSRCGFSDDDGEECMLPNNREVEVPIGVCRDKPKKKPFHLFITVCMHGNERTGMVAFNELMEEGVIPELLSKRDTETKLTVMLGNPSAVVENKRFIKKNLNRIIHPPGRAQPDLYEAKRAMLIERMALNSSQWLDVHSTSSPCQPYALPTGNPPSEELAERLEIDTIISKLVHHTVEGGTSCDWALHHNKTCVCVECGQEGTREAIDTAKRVIISFILGHRLSSAERRRYISTNRVKVGEGFRFVRRVQAFEHVDFNELLAVDDEVGEIRCPYEEGAVVIMPTAAPVVGEEAWFWGRANHEIESV